MSVESPIAVVLMNMGGPDSLEAVEPFLYNLFRDHDLIPLPLGFLWQRRFARMVSRGRAKTVGGLEIDRWPEQPAYLDALAEQVRRGLEQFPEAARTGVELLFSAHGLPETFIKKGDPYVKDLERTIAGVLLRLGGQRAWRLSF